MYATYLKEYKVYLKRAKFLIQSETDNHPIALSCLLIYYAGLIKYLSINQQTGQLRLKLNKRCLTNWLFSFNLEMYDKFLYFVIEKFYANVNQYHSLLLKNVDDGEIEQHIVMLDLLFDSEELVLSRDVLTISNAKIYLHSAWYIFLIVNSKLTINN